MAFLEKSVAQHLHAASVPGNKDGAIFVLCCPVPAAGDLAKYMDRIDATFKFRLIVTHCAEISKKAYTCQ